MDSKDRTPAARPFAVSATSSLVHVAGEVAHPVRRQSARAQRILAAGGLSDDPLAVRIGNMYGPGARLRPTNVSSPLSLDQSGAVGTPHRNPRGGIQHDVVIVSGQTQAKGR